ncbi:MULTISPECIES: sulfurtransferase [Streptomyces]|uniref:Sulfurtransferase n=1 Tax=Streptomyces evansiae TaxID=3075535 RepID=A0ABU2QW73_9ACTN|nr:MULTISPECIES: sulfurtransferase [unclassified Streptomyces]MDT0408337.1 sulfurtransferase [Streptomyces sp. DSM 41979]MYQ60405.1 sulfurtransferase [Streptomyces sp. SID4926]SCE04273.1 thiosulfate/3-mercaptopyruvate sulfurtransferase [Streptomyces sp. DfronAA-171]
MTTSQPAPVSPLIDADTLATALAGPRPPVVLDVRYRLGQPSRRPAYLEGHVPGAVFVDLDTQLAAPPGPRGRHPLPEPGDFGAAMRAAGVSADSQVVVYDDGQGWAAARTWWLLRWSGHSAVRVLDGGFPSWTGALETGAPAPAAGDFVPRPGALPTLDAGSAAELARKGLLFDARAGERYRGEVEPIDPVGGHIPGAVSAPTAENVLPDGRFRPVAELRARFADLGADGDQAVGVYCGSGVSAAQEVLALELAGVRAALYPGSWSEWTADSGRPVATGAERG